MSVGKGERGERRQLAQEVVELGEELFELALRGYAGTEGETVSMDEAAYPVTELRAAVDEFFRVLRGLLDVGAQDNV